MVYHRGPLSQLGFQSDAESVVRGEDKARSGRRRRTSACVGPLLDLGLCAHSQKAEYV